MVKINSASDAKTKFIDIARRLGFQSKKYSGRVQRRARSPRALKPKLKRFKSSLQDVGTRCTSR
jgi:hypothetical protein